MPAHTCSCPGSRGSGRHARAVSPRRKLLLHGRVHPPAAGHKQTRGDGGCGNPGPGQRREGAGARMGATEAGGTKSPRLLSALRRWRAGRRLRRMRSAFRAERSECERGGHQDGHWGLGRSSGYWDTPQKPSPRCPDSNRVGAGLGVLPSPESCLPAWLCLGENPGRHATEYHAGGSPPRPHTRPSSCSAVPLGR